MHYSPMFIIRFGSIPNYFKHELKRDISAVWVQSIKKQMQIIRTSWKRKMNLVNRMLYKDTDGTLQSVKSCFICGSTHAWC
jgi:hypothetical protein